MCDYRCTGKLHTSRPTSVGIQESDHLFVIGYFVGNALPAPMSFNDTCEPTRGRNASLARYAANDLCEGTFF